MGDRLGKFRGKVVNNVDPLMLGRLLVHVPAVSELPLPNWAMPCVPYAGDDVGFFALPPIKANVWVEFEGGDPNMPVWSGCFWGEGEVPTKPAVPTTKILKTEFGSITLDDLKRELKLEVTTPAGKFSLVTTPKGMTLSTSTAQVSITPTKIELMCDPANVSVSPKGISAAIGTATLDLEPTQSSLKNAGASVELSPAMASLKNGAMGIDVSPASVSINKGALEVT